MKDLTHLCVGAAVGVVCTGFDSSPDAVGWAALLVGSLLPDIDHKRSFIGKYVPWVSATLERKFGHRTLTHSLLGFALFALALSPTLIFSDSLLPWALMGIASHVLLDTFNIQGVPLFYPFSRLEFVAFHNRAWRIPYGSPAEMTLLACVSLGTLALIPLAKGGFSPAFHRMVGSPGATVEDFQRWRDDFKVYALLDGDAPLQREAQRGRRFRILDALGPEMLLVEDESGRAYRVAAGSQADEAEMWAFRVTAEKGEEIAVRRWTVEMTGRSIGDLLDLLPESGECFVNADLVLATSWQHKPITGEFSRASASGSNLTLRSARGEDLRAIRNVVVASGVALVRAEFEHGKAEGMAEVDHFTKHAREVLLEDLPDMQSCLVNVGDEVREGQALVRNAHKEKVLSERSKLGDARAQLLLAAETMQKNEETAAARLKVQRSAIEDA
ncbi:metal-dependent hydrolase, partial [Rubritalea tangerina]